MIRGFMQTSSRTIMVAAAGMLMSAYVSAPAMAADLGGGCCGDLEERVAELEVTAAKKGNRVVSLQVYGQVNKSLLMWDDGIDSGAFVVDNDWSGSRLGFTGTAKVMKGLSVGYLLEFDYQDAASDKVNNGLPFTGLGARNGDDVNSFFNPAVNNGEISIRYNNWYIDHERLGRITVGQGSTASDGAYEIVLANSLRYGDINHGNAFAIRLPRGTGLHSFGVLSDTPQAGASWAGDLDAQRDQVIRYDSPTIYGFILSASWGDNSYADVALRFKKEMNSIRVAAGVAYQWDSTRDASLASLNPDTGSVTVYDYRSLNNQKFQAFGGSFSVMHVPTGLYMAFASAQRWFDASYNPATGDDWVMPDPRFWYLQVGVERKWLPFGTTTLYGEYGDYRDFRFDGIHDMHSEAKRVGFGAVQKLDAAAMDIYAQATLWSFNRQHVIYPATGDGSTDYGWVKPDDLTTIMVGSRIKF